MEKNEIKAVLDKLGLSASFQFVPFSKSRSKAEKDPSLNYLVTVYNNGRELFTVDYMMGCGHAPSYKAYGQTVDGNNAVKKECETGRDKRLHAILPDLVDVFYSLVMDAEAIDYTFEDWAENYGMSSDSRKAEKMYNECVQQAIKLRSAIGDAGLRELQEAYQDY